MNDLDTLTVLKLLAKGRPRHMVAAAVGVTPAEVDQVGGENGMPDQHLLRAAARRLESELAATIPTAAAAREHPLVFSPVMEPASGGNAEGERTKRCSKCRTPKPLSGFHVDRRRSDGLCLQCKECMREAPSQRYRPTRRRGPCGPVPGSGRCAASLNCTRAISPVSWPRRSRRHAPSSNR